MNELAFERDYTALLTEAQQLQAALTAKSRSVTACRFGMQNLKVVSFSSIGVYAHKGYALYCHIQRIKRKTEPVQRYLNRDKAVILPAVEDLHTGIFLGFPYFFTKQLKSA